jgi:hypothetical protein
MKKWDDIKREAIQKCIRLSKEYRSRLLAELKEIEKQGLNNYWIDNYNNEVRWDSNKNGLVLPFLLGMTEVDPVKSVFTYELCTDGEMGDVVDIVVSGTTYSVPSECLVMTKKGLIRAGLLEVGDELT